MYSSDLNWQPEIPSVIHLYFGVQLGILVAIILIIFTTSGNTPQLDSLSVPLGKLLPNGHLGSVPMFLA